MKLTPQEKEHLLALAHFSIESGFRPPDTYLTPTEDSNLYEAKLGAFVTLTIDKKLRGCIGYIQSDDELTKTIMEAAYQAAFNDPRFAPLTENEFSEVKIEISILSEASKISIEDIELGKHGLILEAVGRKALLLPQVPIEHNMNKEEFLSALCNKAGLQIDYWKENPINLLGFTATVFSEN